MLGVGKSSRRNYDRYVFKGGLKSLRARRHLSYRIGLFCFDELAEYSGCWGSEGDCLGGGYFVVFVGFCEYIGLDFGVCGLSIEGLRISVIMVSCGGFCCWAEEDCYCGCGRELVMSMLVC